MKLIFIIALLLHNPVLSQNKVNVILIGTVHFNNPGYDRGKLLNINILQKSKQDDLEKITNKIVAKYRPDKVFVESPYEYREDLYKKYELYKKGLAYYNADTITNAFLKKYYLENEIFQLGFRLAKKANNQKIYSIDYNLEQRYDLISSEINKSLVIDSIVYYQKLNALNTFINKCIGCNSLIEIYKCLNSKEELLLNKGMYISTINRLNNNNDFFGSEFVASWFERNLIMYSFVQNQVFEEDKTIIIIVGVGHASMFYDFLKNDSKFNIIDIDDVFR